MTPIPLDEKASKVVAKGRLVTLVGRWTTAGTFGWDGVTLLLSNNTLRVMTPSITRSNVSTAISAAIAIAARSLRTFALAASRIALAFALPNAVMSGGVRCAAGGDRGQRPAAKAVDPHHGGFQVHFLSSLINEHGPIVNLRMGFNRVWRRLRG